MPEEPKRLPCPFCGSTTSTVGSVPAGATVERFVRCSGCRGQGPKTLAIRTVAIEAWNRRAQKGTGDAG